ncbi:MAG: sulfonate/nitrate/taurine transporter substrate-binding protein [Clostridiales bacterium]|nr:MAG: sulfonate/nitrate/taurine transporter substrate-binding protein [Clostridiales bacterium]
MKKILAVLLVLCLSVMLFACGRTEGEDVTVRVVTLQGPTGMGMVQLMTSDEAGTSANDYEFTLASSPEEAQAAIANVDIAALPVNLAAALYNRGEDISFAAINTLGVLSILENGNTIESIEDLRGKTIYATGQGSTPEYILNYLLEKNGIDPETDVTIEYLTEHTELATRLASGDAAIGLLPEPNVTVALTSAAANGNTDLRIALDVTEEWAKLGEGELVQGCIVVSNEFKTEHPEQFEAFMEEYKASVNYVNTDIEAAATDIAEVGIVPRADIAQNAIPNCNICCLDGEEGIAYMEAMLTVLYEANPSSVGGKMPDDAFYGE